MNYKPIKGNLSNDFGFKLVNGIIQDKTKVYCLHCSKEFAYSGSVTSLKYHRDNKHPSTRHRKRGHQEDQEAVIIEAKKQKSIEDYCNKPISASKKKEITNALTNWIVTNCRPINIVTDDGLQEVLRLATGCDTYELPSRPTISKRLISIYDEHKMAMKKSFEEVEFISLTGDFWSSISNHSYLGVTAHFIDKNWDFKDTVLDVQISTTRHTAQLCSEAFSHVVDNWNIREKIQFICTDNAANITLGITLGNFKNLRCAAHTIQLSIQKGLEVASVDKVLGKCRKIVGHFKHSPSNQRELDKIQTSLGHNMMKLQQDVETRWNSTLIMISSLIKCKEALRNYLKDSTKFYLPENDWAIIEKLEVILQPCREVTELLGGSKYVTSSVVLPAFKYLKSKMVIDEDEPGYISRFKAMLVDDLKNRMSSWPYINIYRIATALDPRFKSLGCMNESDRSNTWNELISMLQPLTDDSNLNRNSTQKRKFSFGPSQNIVTTIDHELSVYKSLPEVDDDFADPCKWWSLHSLQFPRLSVIARRYLSSPATSVPSERVFSKAGIIVNKLRNSLHPDNVNRLVCLNSWLNK